jgi:hypothetical protein
LTVTVYIIEAGTESVPPSYHGAHGQAHASVREHSVGQEFGGSSNGDASVVVELVEAALSAEVSFPELTISCASCHGAKEVGVDFNDFFDGLGGDIGALTGTGIYGDDDTTLKDEAEGGGSVVGFDVFYNLTLKGVNLREEERS